MQILSRGGDVAEVAPEVAEAAALFLYAGFNEKSFTWNDRFRKMPRILIGKPEDLEHPSLRDPRSFEDRPWEVDSDTVWKFEPPWGQLRYLYVFANPRNSKKCRDLNAVRAAVTLSLDRLSRLGVKRIAMIHIAAADADDLTSARTMVDSLRTWGRNNPGQVDTVVLIDLKDDFARALQNDG